MDRGGDGGRRLWYMRNVDLDVLRSVNSYLQRDPESSSAAMKRILVVVQHILDETKDWLSFLHLPRDRNPPPPSFLALELPEVQIAVPLISHVLQLLTVINSDFDSMKEHLNGVELSKLPAYEQNARFLIDRFLSGVVKMLDSLVLDEIKAQKTTDLELLLWNTSSSTLDSLITGLLAGFCKLDNPNPLDSLGKLHRIRQCLQHVLTLTREYLLTHRLLLLPLPEPQPHSFPIADLPPSMEQGTVMSLVNQQTNDALHLIDLLNDCLMRMLDYDLGKLRMVDLEEVDSFVHKVKTTLEERAFAEGT